MSYHKVLRGTNVSADTMGAYGALVVPVKSNSLKIKDFNKSLPSGYGTKTANALAAAAKARQFEGKPGQTLDLDLGPTQTFILAVLPEELSAFEVLKCARKAANFAFQKQAAKLLVDLRALDPGVDDLVADAFAATVGTKRYLGPKYGEAATKKKAPYLPKVDILADASRYDEVKAEADRSATETEATNLVRYLAELPPNDLTCKSYVDRCRELAKENGLKFEYHNFAKLEKMGAGAFVAVAQGSDHRDSGIVALHYEPKGAQKHIAFVGKGLVYDTGGHNLKTGNYMFGMHGDMTGSAVALAMVTHAARAHWPERVSAYLAIADNAISNTAYRPNEVVVSLSGKSIEIVNTDAEGRMALSDTLTLASRTKPDVMMDFATLTGSAVRAIGTRYCTGYSNNEALRELIVPAGRESGERVWSFPLDKDFADCLKSDYADTKQCNQSGGVDHIEAASFLSLFVENKTPWVHIDLAAAENEGGLAHVGTKTTGFGVRFASRFIEKWRQTT